MRPPRQAITTSASASSAATAAAYRRPIGAVTGDQLVGVWRWRRGGGSGSSSHTSIISTCSFSGVGRHQGAAALRLMATTTLVSTRTLPQALTAVSTPGQWAKVTRHECAMASAAPRASASARDGHATLGTVQRRCGGTRRIGSLLWQLWSSGPATAAAAVQPLSALPLSRAADGSGGARRASVRQLAPGTYGADGRWKEGGARAGDAGPGADGCAAPSGPYASVARRHVAPRGDRGLRKRRLGVAAARRPRCGRRP